MRVCMSLQLSACSSLDSVAEGDSSNSGHGHHGHHGHHHHSHHPPPGGLHFARDLQHLSKMFINASMLPRPKSESNFRVRFQLNRISETDAYFTSPQLLIHPSIRAATGRSAVEKDESVPDQGGDSKEKNWLKCWLEKRLYIHSILILRRVSTTYPFLNIFLV